MSVFLWTDSFEDFFSVVTEHHEQVDFPARVAVHRVHLKRETCTHMLLEKIIHEFSTKT